jgi:hypothetical protein
LNARALQRSMYNIQSPKKRKIKDNQILINGDEQYRRTLNRNLVHIFLWK